RPSSTRSAPTTSTATSRTTAGSTRRTSSRPGAGASACWRSTSTTCTSSRGWADEARRMNPLLDDDLTGPRPPIFLGALRTTLGRTPIWLACWLVPLFLALVLAVPWRGFYAGVLANRYEPGRVLS